MSIDILFFCACKYLFSIAVEQSNGSQFDTACWILLAGVIVAGVGLYLAYRQLTHVSDQLSILRKSTNANFLFELDSKFDEIFESRKAARTLAEEIEREIGADDWQRDERLSKEFTNKLEGLRQDKSEEYFKLMKIPDFCETVGFLVVSEYIQAKDVKGLWGPAIRNWVKWFRCHIESRQQKEGTDLYEYFLNTFSKLE